MIELLNTDCMEYMRTLPDNAFTLAVVDPPYGVGSVTYMPMKRENTCGGYVDIYNITVAVLDNAKQRPSQNLHVEHNMNTASTISGFGDFNVAPPPDYFRELFRVSRNQVIFGGNYFLLPPCRCFGVWRKINIPASGFSMAPVEYFWTSFNGNALYIEANAQSTNNDKRIHPTQKPTKLYARILAELAKPGYRILDTHLGSGSSAIAAHEAGLDFVGCELNENYFTAARDRLARHQQQMMLKI